MLHIHRAQRADVLADELAAILLEPAGDPFAAEVVSVPTRGMERWLAQRLSGRLGVTPGGADGVCANIEFPFPGRIISAAVTAASGEDPSTDPWRAEHVVWPLLEVVDGCLLEPWLAPLADHLRGGSGNTAPLRERRFARVRQLADLYDHYGVWRPAMLRCWAQGEDRDGDGRALGPATAWQAELWRRLRGAIGTPSLAERLGPACRSLVEHPGRSALPARFSLFGLTRLPPSQLEVLCALAHARDMHLFVLHPSPALWERVAAHSGGRPRLGSRSLDTTALLAANRLLASWGQDSRELQLVLSAGAPDRADHVRPLPDRPKPTLLAAIQADIAADRAPPGPPLPGRPDTRLELRERDRSLQVHACHGRSRQVQTLRESILHALQDDPTLEPRDMIVMCPDIETFAPLITATFGAPEPREHAEHTGEAAGSVELRVRLADRSLRATNPVLGVLARLLDLAESRVTASQVLDLADTEPVRRRFAFDDDELARLRDWVVSSEIHWGLDETGRIPYRLGSLAYGTWRAGLRRLLLGVAVSESGRSLYEGVLPVDDVDSGAIDLAGRFAELIERLGTALDQLHGPHTLKQWAITLAACTDALAVSSDSDAWQRDELTAMLDGILSEAAGGAASATLALSELRALLGRRLAGRPTRANFRTGELTVCTLVPMRSVPHRVVCLLGLDDGAFPRRSPRDGDDLLLADPHIGDRDPRTEDRQMLLDALLAARETLIVTYNGNDERTNAALPPAVVVGELLDAVDATARRAHGRARDQVVTHHPLQPFDARNFRADVLVPGGPWSFDAVELEGARALSAPRSDKPPFLAAPLPEAEAAALSLQDLVGFAERPVRAFLRQRLGISTSERDDDVRDELPVVLDALRRWGVGQRLLEGVLAGIDGRTVALAELARGALPPGQLGRPVLSELWPDVELIARHARVFSGDQPPRSVEANVQLPGGPLLTGTVSGVHAGVLLTVTFSRLNPRHRLAAWVRLLALTAAHPQERLEAVTIGRASAGDQLPLLISHVPMPAGDADARRDRALEWLGDLVDLRTRGMREPLPLPSRTAAAYARAAWSGASLQDAQTGARTEWESGYQHDGEDREPDHLLAFGAELTFEELYSASPRASESGPGWVQDERSRLGRLARRLWDPLLALEWLEEQ